MVIKRKKIEEENEGSSRKQLNIERIVKVAIDLLNKEGLNQLSMRRLAGDLGIRAASLYWHVKDKSELLQLVADTICCKIQIPDSSLPWKEQILLALNEYRAALLTVNDSAQILIDTAPFTYKRLNIINAIFRIFLEAGLPPEEVVMISASINNFVLSFVMDEMRLSRIAKEQGKTVDEIAVIASEIFRNLPKDQYASTVFIADFTMKIDRNREFKFGLELIMEGIKTRLNK